MLVRPVRPHLRPSLGRGVDPGAASRGSRTGAGRLAAGRGRRTGLRRGIPFPPAGRDHRLAAGQRRPLPGRRPLPRLSRQLPGCDPAQASGVAGGLPAGPHRPARGRDRLHPHQGNHPARARRASQRGPVLLCGDQCGRGHGDPRSGLAPAGSGEPGRTLPAGRAGAAGMARPARAPAAANCRRQCPRRAAGSPRGPGRAPDPIRGEHRLPAGRPLGVHLGGDEPAPAAVELRGAGPVGKCRRPHLARNPTGPGHRRAPGKRAALSRDRGIDRLRQLGLRRGGTQSLCQRFLPPAGRPDPRPMRRLQLGDPASSRGTGSHDGGVARVRPHRENLGTRTSFQGGRRPVALRSRPRRADPRPARPDHALGRSQPRHFRPQARRKQ